MDLKPEVEFLNNLNKILKKWVDEVKQTTQGEKVRNFHKMIERDLSIFEYIITSNKDLVQRFEEKQAEEEIPKLPELPSVSTFKDTNKNRLPEVHLKPSSAMDYYKNYEENSYEEQAREIPLTKTQQAIELIKKHKIISIIAGLLIIGIIYFSFLTTPEPTSQLKFLDLTP